MDTDADLRDKNVGERSHLVFCSKLGALMPTQNKKHKKNANSVDRK